MANRQLGSRGPVVSTSWLVALRGVRAAQCHDKRVDWLSSPSSARAAVAISASMLASTGTFSIEPCDRSMLATSMCRDPDKQMRVSQHALLPSQPPVCMLDTLLERWGSWSQTVSVWSCLKGRLHACNARLSLLALCGVASWLEITPLPIAALQSGLVGFTPPAPRCRHANP